MLFFTLPTSLQSKSSSRAGAEPKCFVELKPEQSVLLIQGCNQHGDWWEKPANSLILSVCSFRYTVRSSKWSQAPKRGQAKGATWLELHQEAPASQPSRALQGPTMGSDPTTASLSLSRSRSEHSICCTDGAFKEPPSVENIDSRRRKPSCTPTAARPPEGTGWEMPRDGKCCSHSFNPFKSCTKRFDWDDFFSSLVLQPCQMSIRADLPVPCYHRYIDKTHSAMAQVVWVGAGFWLQYRQNQWDLHIYDLDHSLPNCFPAGKQSEIK